VKEIKGDTSVRSLAFDLEGEEKNNDVQGIFVNIGLFRTVRLQGRSPRSTDRGEIRIDSTGATSNGGYVRCGRLYRHSIIKQIIIASGAGAIAAISAFRYLTKFQG